MAMGRGLHLHAGSHESESLMAVYLSNLGLVYQAGAYRLLGQHFPRCKSRLINA